MSAVVWVAAALAVLVTFVACAAARRAVAADRSAQRARHEVSPSGGRLPAAAGPVSGAPGVAAPGADAPTVGVPADGGKGSSASPAAVEGPAEGGEASAPPSAAALGGQCPYPDGTTAGWACPCGASGYLLQGASPEDIAGYEQGAAAHVDVCFEGGAL